MSKKTNVSSLYQVNEEGELTTSNGFIEEIKKYLTKKPPLLYVMLVSEKTPKKIINKQYKHYAINKKEAKIVIYEKYRDGTFRINIKSYPTILKFIRNENEEGYIYYQIPFMNEANHE